MLAVRHLSSKSVLFLRRHFSILQLIWIFNGSFQFCAMPQRNFDPELPKTSKLCELLSIKSTYCQLFFLWCFLGLHSGHHIVDAVIVWQLDAANGHTIVNASLIDGCRQRILRQGQLCGHDQGCSSFIVSLASISEQLPDILGTTRSSLYSQQDKHESKYSAVQFSIEE